MRLINHEWHSVTRTDRTGTYKIPVTLFSKTAFHKKVRVGNKYPMTTGWFTTPSDLIVICEGNSIHKCQPYVNIEHSIENLQDQITTTDVRAYLFRQKFKKSLNSFVRQKHTQKQANHQYPIAVPKPNHNLHMWLTGCHTRSGCCSDEIPKSTLWVPS